MEKGALNILELEDKVFNMQEQMINTGLLKGLTHPETIKCSQELDILLNTYLNVKSK